jgi:hypothetical protein
MTVRMTVQFVEEGTAENPFPPRSWSMVPRIGETVRLPETGRLYRVLGVEWTHVRRRDGGYDEDAPLVIVRIRE